MCCLICIFQINAEFLRITTVPLQPRFLAGLDKQSSQLLQVMRKKGGAVGQKIRDTLKPLDQVWNAYVLHLISSFVSSVLSVGELKGDTYFIFHLLICLCCYRVWTWTECLLKSLVIYLGEDVSHLIKEYLVSQQIMAVHWDQGVFC